MYDTHRVAQLVQQLYEMEGVTIPPESRESIVNMVEDLVEDAQYEAKKDGYWEGYHDAIF